MTLSSFHGSLIAICTLASIAALSGGGCYLSRLASPEADLGRDAGIDASLDTGSAPVGIPLEDFCAALQDATCGVVLRCECGAAAVENCRSAVWGPDCLERVVSPDLALAVAQEPAR